MIKTKKLLALALSLAMILSVVLSVPFTTSALDGYVWYSCNPNKGGWADYNMFPAPSAEADALGSGYWTARATTIEEFQAAGWFDKAQTPYATFYLNATQDTTVNLAPAYSIGAANGATLTNYSMTVFVNDKDYYVGNGNYTGTGSAYVPEGQDMVYNVKLTKGMNIVRMVATGKADGDKIWANLNGLAVQQKSDVTVTKVSEVTYMPGTSQYAASGYTDNANDGTLGNAWAVGSLTYENYYWDNVNDTSNYSVTISVPADGHYEIEQYLNTGKTYKNGDAHTGIIPLFVDGNRNALHYQDYDDNRGAKSSAAGTSLYLTAGNHVLTFAQGLNKTRTDSWFNMGKLIIRGGATIAATQIDPATIANPSLAYPDTDARLTNMVADSTQQVGGGHGLVKLVNGPITIDTGNASLQTYSDMKNNGISDNRIYTVDYALKVREDGKYTIKPRMNIGSGSGYDPAASGYFVAVAVNNKNFYQQSIEALGYYDLEFEIDLEAGLNSVRLIFICNETKSIRYPEDIAWVNHQYMRLGDGIEVVKPASFVKNAGNYILNGFTQGSGQAGNVGASFGTIGLSGSGLTSETVTSADFYRIPFVSFTVDTQYDGYYDFDLKIGVNSTHNGATGNINVFVDNNKQNVHYYQYQSGAASFMTIYIPKGTHVITMTNVWEYSKGGLIEQYATWNDYRDMTFRSPGISWSSTQINPLANVDSYKTDHIAIVDAARESADSASAKTALDNLVAQINAYTGTGKNAGEWQADLTAISSTAAEVAATERAKDFASVKEGIYASLAQAEAIYPGGDDTITLIAEKKAVLDPIVYDNNKTYAENVAVIDVIDDGVANTITNALNADQASFETRRTAIINVISNRATEVDSAAVTQIIADGVAQANALQYDITINLTENYKNFGSISGDNNTAVKAQRAAEKTDVANKVAEIGNKATATDTAAISAAINTATAYTYDDAISYEQNVAAVDALAANIDKLNQAKNDQLHVWKQFQNGITSASETANVRFIFTIDTATNTYTDYGFYITIDGIEEKYSYFNATHDALGRYDALYFDNSDMANKIVYLYIVVPNVAFDMDITAKAYFTDANGEYIGDSTTVNIANRIAQ